MKELATVVGIALIASSVHEVLTWKWWLLYVGLIILCASMLSIINKITEFNKCQN